MEGQFIPGLACFAHSNMVTFVQWGIIVKKNIYIYFLLYVCIYIHTYIFNLIFADAMTPGRVN